MDYIIEIGNNNHVTIPLPNHVKYLSCLTNTMVKIAPSILAADFACLGCEIKKAEKSGADMIHLDIMDGHFVPNLTFGKDIAAMSKKATKLPHDAHLMVTHPEYYIADFAALGVEYITFHLEIDGTRMDVDKNRWVYILDKKKPNAARIRKLINDIKIAGSKAGLTLNPPTPFKDVIPFLKDLDLLLLMSVNPGFAGQAFISSVYDKLEQADSFRKENGLRYEIMVDGGVGVGNLDKLVRLGADILVSGKSFFTSSDFLKAVERLKA